MSSDDFTTRNVGRWWPAAVVALVTVAIGAATGTPAVVGLAVPAVAFLLYGYVDTAPAPTVTIDRTLSDAEPLPDETVDVEVTVRNDGSWPLPDLRVIDGVPTGLRVVDGSPRIASALRAGDSTSFTYSVRAFRGQHVFSDAEVIARNVSGSQERVTALDTMTSMTCIPPLTGVPLRSQTSQYTGRISTDVGGPGIEFHSIREYRPGDPMKRIDWNRYARTGTLATTEYREERAATVCLLVDDRDVAYWADVPSARHAVEHCVGAAGQLFATLLDLGDRVGIAAIDDETAWLAPGAGSDHHEIGQRLLAVHPAFSYDPPASAPELSIDPDHDEIDLSRVLSRLTPDTQVIAMSPLCDDAIVEAVEYLDASGHAVTVVSPDPTVETSPGRRLAGIQRRNRLGQLRAANVSVFDWQPADRLVTALTKGGAD